ncbi:Transcription factor SFL1 [Spathaspora sp. JA1]|nr:Transcription factor SFL1 [Spathaspora sp. JA1]
MTNKPPSATDAVPPPPPPPPPPIESVHNNNEHLPSLPYASKESPSANETATSAAATAPIQGQAQSTQMNASGSTTNGKTQVVFIHKLYDMLQDDSISHLIFWSPSLDSFYVTPGEEFSRALAQYFKHTNIASFIRQLNMYGFHKVNETFLNQEEQQQQQQMQGNIPGSNNKWEFRHSTNQFRKGDVESLKLIKRRSSRNITSQREIVSIKSLPPTSQPSDYQAQQRQQHQQQQQQSYPYHFYSEDDGIRDPNKYQSVTSPTQPMPTPGTPPIPPSQQHSLPPQPLQHHGSISSQPGSTRMSQDYSNPASTLVQTSFENSINFKFLEMNSQLNGLRNDLTVMSNRCDMLQQDLKGSNSDCLAILDMFENWVRQPDIDRAKSPLQVKEDPSIASSPSDKHKAIIDIQNIKNAIIKRSNQPHNIPHHHSSSLPSLPPAPPPPPQQQHQTYHLDSTSRSSSNPNIHIVPQPYPLNPQYSIYKNENVFRPKEDNDPNKRNMSVYDPLQPIPSRHNSRVLIDEPNVQLPPTLVPTSNTLAQPSFRLRAESTYSPLSVAGSKQQPQPGSPVSHPHPPPPPPPGPTSTNHYSNPSSSRSSVESKKPIIPLSVQQQQPQPQSQPQPQQQPYCEQPPSYPAIGSRTNSLPTPRTEKYNSPRGYYYQRNSFTSMYEPKYNPLPQQQQQQSSSTQTNGTRYGSPPRSIPEQLPSVSELDKSIQGVGGSVSPVSVGLPPLFKKKNDIGDSDLKKRRLD